MYYFKQKEKEKVLQGRTITYLAENKFFVTKEYLCQILSGKRGCSKLLATNILNCIGAEVELDDYFYMKGE